jgi:PD-(D/E)XK nuclease superfamily
MDIPEFLRVIELHQEAIERAKHLYRARLAPEFNPFEFIEPDERKLSRIVAVLLDPLGSHGQGGRFLGLFLKTLGAPWPADVCDKATARTEFFVGNGSIDVYVKSAFGILAIENKPWAGDQAKQLHRYLAHLAQAGLSKYCIVYLTEDGRDPPADSICESERTSRIEAGQLRLWSYPGQIVEWLTRCRNACRADRVMMFIDEFIRYIQQEFQGVRDMTTQETSMVSAACSGRRLGSKNTAPVNTSLVASSVP